MIFGGFVLDTLIRNGDSSAVLVSGRKELLQQIWIRLFAKQGRFPYDKTLGSLLYSADVLDDDWQLHARRRIQQVLLEQPQVFRDVQITDIAKNGNVITVLVESPYGSDTLCFILKEESGA